MIIVIMMIIIIIVIMLISIIIGNDSLYSNTFWKGAETPGNPELKARKISDVPASTLGGPALFLMGWESLKAQQRESPKRLCLGGSSSGKSQCGNWLGEAASWGGKPWVSKLWVERYRPTGALCCLALSKISNLAPREYPLTAPFESVNSRRVSGDRR